MLHDLKNFDDLVHLKSSATIGLIFKCKSKPLILGLCHNSSGHCQWLKKIGLLITFKISCKALFFKCKVWGHKNNMKKWSLDYHVHLHAECFLALRSGLFTDAYSILRHTPTATTKGSSLRCQEENKIKILCSRTCLIPPTKCT